MLGIVSFVQVFNCEKPIAAIVFGVLAIGQHQLRGKKLAIAGIILGIIGIIATVTMIILFWPQLQHQISQQSAAQ